MPEPSAGLRRIAQIAVIVKDVDKATEFYKNVLGLPHLFSVPRMAFFDCGGTRLMLGPPEKPEFDHPSSILYFDVADIQEAHRILSGRGVHFEAPPHLIAKLPAVDLWMAFFRDCENNLLALQSEVPRS
jgi:methylmalonyl-CoA/ethylmalonyl-CoA epimerase